MPHIQKNTGYAALTTTLITVGISLIILGGLSFFALQEVTINRNFIKSIEAETAAEAGIEDALYRTLAGKQLAASETLGIGIATTTITTAASGTARIIRSEGMRQQYQKNMETAFDTRASGASFNYGMQIGDLGLEMENQARVVGSVYSNGNITIKNQAKITGDAWVAGISGAIDGGMIGESGIGDAHAHAIKNTTIARDAYFQTISGSTVGGAQYPGSSDPPSLPFPISNEQIAEFKAGGDAGGICAQPQCDSSGNFKLDGTESAVLGPIKIPGDLIIENSAILTISGTLHVGGKLTLKNNCTVKLSFGYGALSGVIVVDGVVELENNCALLGSSNPTSYLMILTTSTRLSGPPAIQVKNNASTAILYASEGAIELENQSSLKEAVGKKMLLKNNATLTYETGLNNVNFSTGPSGGQDVKYWKEVE